MAPYVVARADEIGDGERLITTVAGRSIGVFNVGGEYFAMRNRCPHQGAQLCAGTIQGAVDSDEPGRFEYRRDRQTLRCPWHGWEFDLRTGESWFDPQGTRVRAYGVSVARGDLLPSAAETYPASVEADYVVVEIGR